TIQSFVLQEQYRVITTNCCAQQSSGVKGVRGEHDPQSGCVSEDAFATLRVINSAACEISANRHSYHNGRGKGVVRPPPDDGQFIAQFHQRRQNEVEELDLNDRFDPTNRHTGGASDDVRFGERRVEYPIGSELNLQTGRQLENTALTLDQLL